MLLNIQLQNITHTYTHKDPYCQVDKNAKHKTKPLETQRKHIILGYVYMSHTKFGQMSQIACHIQYEKVLKMLVCINNR